MTSRIKMIAKANKIQIMHSDIKAYNNDRGVSFEYS